MAATFCEIDIEDLVFYERCGGGTFGSVYRALWKSQDMVVAVKKLLMLEKEVGLKTCLSNKSHIITRLRVPFSESDCFATTVITYVKVWSYDHLSATITLWNGT